MSSTFFNFSRDLERLRPVHPILCSLGPDWPQSLGLVLALEAAQDGAMLFEDGCEVLGGGRMVNYEF
jgi:hypothetical protein